MSGWAYRVVESFKKNSEHSGYHFHGERHHFAHKLYSDLWQQKTGHEIKAPIVKGLPASSWSWREYAAKVTGISEKEIMDIDKEIRIEVSHQLGHNRLSVTRDYIG